MSTEAHSPPLEHLQAGLFHLLEQYADTPRHGVALAIAEQLEQILRHPLIGVFPELQRQFARCLNGWRLRGCAGVLNPPGSYRLH